ncbi:hypothetical protein HDU97_000800 [Phlyctochytrium planicorne]|nr:hypothetical protein HDU97_000800 [Phlyctochytrium planicorne]
MSSTNVYCVRASSTYASLPKRPSIPHGVAITSINVSTQSARNYSRSPAAIEEQIQTARRVSMQLRRSSSSASSGRLSMSSVSSSGTATTTGSDVSFADPATCGPRRFPRIFY